MSFFQQFGLGNEKIRKGLFFTVVLTLGLIAFPFVLTRLRQSQDIREKAAGLANVASLMAAPDRTTVSLDESDPLFSVSLSLDTGGAPVEAVDLVLIFDPSALELVGISPNEASGFNSFLPIGIEGETFDAAGVISRANSSGRIEFGAVTFDLGDPDNPDDGLLGTAVTGSVPLASLQFRALSPGETTVSFDFDTSREGTAEETRDANVVQIGTDPEIVDDILGFTTSATVTISPGTSTATETPCQKSVGDANCDGTVNLTDFSLWLSVYRKIINDDPVTEEEKAAVDFDYSGSGEHTVSLTDFIIWLETYRQTLGI